MKNEGDVDDRKIAIFKISLATALCWVHLRVFLITRSVCFVLCFLSDIPQSIGESINFTTHAS